MELEQNTNHNQLASSHTTDIRRKYLELRLKINKLLFDIKKEQEKVKLANIILIKC